MDLTNSPKPTNEQRTLQLQEHHSISAARWANFRSETFLYSQLTFSNPRSVSPGEATSMSGRKGMYATLQGPRGSHQLRSVAITFVV